MVCNAASTTRQKGVMSVSAQALLPRYTTNEIDRGID